MKKLLILVALLAVTIASSFFVSTVSAGYSGCDGYSMDNYRCSGNWIQREYKTSDCSYSWKNSRYCNDGCYGNGYCYDDYNGNYYNGYYNDNYNNGYYDGNYYGTYTYNYGNNYNYNYDYNYYRTGCYVSASVSTPSGVYSGDTATSTITLTNDGTDRCRVSFTPWVCYAGSVGYYGSDYGCQYMRCKITDYNYGGYDGSYYYSDGYYYYNYGNDPTVYLRGYGGSVSFDCTRAVYNPGTYVVRLSYTWGYSVGTRDPYLYSSLFTVTPLSYASSNYQTTTTTIATTTTSSTTTVPESTQQPSQGSASQTVYTGYFVTDGLTWVLAGLILVLLIVIAFILIFERQNTINTLRTPV